MYNIISLNCSHSVFFFVWFYRVFDFYRSVNSEHTKQLQENSCVMQNRKQKYCMNTEHNKNEMNREYAPNVVISYAQFNCLISTQICKIHYIRTRSHDVSVSQLNCEHPTKSNATNYSNSNVTQHIFSFVIQYFDSKTFF